MDISTRLKLLRNKANKTQREFAELFNIKQSAYNNYEKNYRKLSVDLAVLIANTTKCDIRWLLTGEGEMFVSESKQKNGKLDNLQAKISEIASKPKSDLEEKKLYDQLKDKSKTLRMPIGGEIAAGEPLEVNYFDEDIDYVDVPSTLMQFHPSNYFVFVVNGHSMHPIVKHKDIVFVLRTYNHDWTTLNNKTVAVRVNGGITLKKLFLNEEERAVILKPFNENFKDIVISYDSFDDFELVGILEAQLRIW